jgi:type IV pilus assembly protein PilQ
MLRMSDLSYQRQGSILRIATVKKLQAEEKEAVDLMDLKKLTQPLKIRNFFINFADLNETVTALKEVLKNGAKESMTTKIVVDAKNGKIIVQDTEENLELIEKFIKNLDVPIKQVLIEAKIVEASEKFTRSIGVNWNLIDGTQAVGGQSLRPALSVGQAGTGKDLGFNLSYGTLPLLGNLSASLNLAELDNTVKVVSAPRIMTLTGNPATVNVTDSVSSLNQSVDTRTTSAPVVNSYTSTAIPTVLTVTPNVTPDNFVTLKVQISRTIGTLNATGRVDTGTRSIDTNILVRDGQTATIGGLYQTDETEGTNGVPGLKNIPFIGALFRGKQELRSKTELLIFLTPRVMTLDFHGAQTKNEGNL